MKIRPSQSLLFLGLLFYCLPMARAVEPLISRITIRGTNIFDFDVQTSLDHFPYNWINRLHFQTREWVIRQELLFKVGDRLDMFTVKETERNLRALSFISAARVAIFPQRNGTVALVVHVNDAWTTEPQINLGGINKVSSVELGFKEKNFLGLGKTLEYFNERKNGIMENRLGYTDPRLLNSRWQMQANASESSITRSRSLLLNRPFYSADTKWSSHLSYSHTNNIVSEYQNNIKYSEYEQTQESSEIGAALKLGGGRNIVNHAGLRFKTDNTINNPTGGTNPGETLPAPDKPQTVFLDLDSTRNRFIEATQLEKMTRIEDLNLGPSLTLSPGISPHLLTGQTNDAQFSGSAQGMVAIGDNHLFQTKLNYSSNHTFEQPTNQVWNTDLKYYLRGFPRQTLVMHGVYGMGNNLDANHQLELGGDNGLRAYKSPAFRGDRMFLVNLEDRIFMLDNLWDLLALGGVFFYDTGYAWNKTTPFSWGEVGQDAGIGLRFGLTHSSSEAILRLDFAYRMDNVPNRGSRYVIVFGSNQAF